MSFDGLIPATESTAKNRNPADGHDQDAPDKAGEEGPFEETNDPYCKGIHQSQFDRCQAVRSRVNEYTFVYCYCSRLVVSSDNCAEESRSR